MSSAKFVPGHKFLYAPVFFQRSHPPKRNFPLFKVSSECDILVTMPLKAARTLLAANVRATVENILLRGQAK